VCACVHVRLDGYECSESVAGVHMYLCALYLVSADSGQLTQNSTNNQTAVSDFYQVPGAVSFINMCLCKVSHSLME
jgi:hypothetical protein